MIRSPIVATLGHVDHGKTTLLDKIRKTSVARKEAGGITQHVGASYVSRETIINICGDLLEKYNIKLEIPGLLFIDTPGHEAFVTLRKRGGAASDLAILVIDINQGFQPQTDESLAILREYRVPFVVAATKIDLLPYWNARETSSFLESFKLQNQRARDELEKKVYMLVSQLSQRGFESERFDRVKDFTREVAIVPCSGISGEGISELLLVLAGLAQRFLKGKLELSNLARGVVLEVKEMRGFGKVIDVVLYDGRLRKGDFLVIGGREVKVTRVKAILLPREAQDIRVEKRFRQVNEITAACGARLACVDLTNVLAGSTILATSDENEVEKLVKEVRSEIASIEFARDISGVIAKADTLGSLEALLKMLRDRGIAIRKAEIGNVNKEDVFEASLLEEKKHRCILAFNVTASDEIKALAIAKGVAIIEGNVIYKLVEAYEEHCKRLHELEIKKLLELVTWPAKLRVLPGFVFRRSKPAIFGVEVAIGKIKPGVVLMNREGKVVGEIKEIQSEGVAIKEARQGSRVAISVSGATIGRNVKEGDELFTKLKESDFIAFKEKLGEMLTEEEKELLSFLERACK